MSNEAYTVIEGTIEGFESAPGNINLLEKISSNNAANNVATGVVGALGGMYGVVANSAMLAMYEGEDVENFIFTIDGKIVCGSLKLNAMLKDGDYIKAVVSKNEELFVAEAIARPSDTLMWMFGPAFTGTKTLLLKEMKPVYIVAIVSTVAFFAFYFMDKKFQEHFRDLLGLFFVFAGVVFLTFLYCYANYRDFRRFSLKTESIFNALDFPDPDRFDLMPGFVGRAYNYAKAIKKYEDKKAGIKPPKRKRRSRK